jgi:hypothetical protein
MAQPLSHSDGDVFSKSRDFGPGLDWRRELRGRLALLHKRIERLSDEIEALARQDSACERLMTVPGIGPIISSTMVAAIGTVAADYARRLGGEEMIDTKSQVARFKPSTVRHKISCSCWSSPAASLPRSRAARYPARHDVVRSPTTSSSIPCSWHGHRSSIADTLRGKEYEQASAAEARMLPTCGAFVMRAPGRPMIWRKTKTSGILDQQSLRVGAGPCAYAAAGDRTKSCRLHTETPAARCFLSKSDVRTGTFLGPLYLT